MELRKELTEQIRGKDVSRKDKRIHFNRKLLDILIILPAVLAANIHDHKSIIDQKYVKGCEYLFENQYTKAIKCFLAKQKLSGENTSIVSETLSSSSGSLALTKDHHSVSSVENRRHRISFDAIGKEMSAAFSDD